MPIQDVQAGGGGAAGALLRAALAPAAWAFGLAVAWRTRAYDRGGRRVERLPVPVVSVGNLVAGGTGKTPVTALLVQRLRALGRHPGVLARGYGPRVAGGLSDEGAVLEALCGPGLPQREDPDRVRGGRALLAAPGAPDVLLLDDGFQHRRLARDLDLVLLDATCPWGHGHLLPRGLLRERPRALARAHLVALTRCEQVEPAVLAALEREVAGHTRAPVLRLAFRPRHVEVAGRREPPGWLAGRAVLALAGVGRPQAFRRTLEALGAEVRATRFLADHGALPPGGLEDVLAQAQRVGAACVVTTRKDAVKLAAPLPPALAVLDIEAELLAGEAPLAAALARVLAPPSA
ncbi:MAG: tetraacyldisaccharide 4'-kinase [Planctomycetia bacterium]